MSDRRVHAVTRRGSEVVRYERAGKWVIERSFGRQGITLAQAVEFASRPDSEVRLGVPGGKRFDAAVRKALETEPIAPRKP